MPRKEGSKNGGHEGKEPKGEHTDNPSRHRDDPEGMTLKEKDKKTAALMAGIRKKLAQLATLCGTDLRYITVLENSRGQSIRSCLQCWAWFLHGKQGYKSLLSSRTPASTIATVQEEPPVMVGKALKSLKRSQIRSLWCSMGWDRLLASFKQGGVPESLQHLQGMVLDFGQKGEGDNKFAKRSADSVDLIMCKGWQPVGDVAGYRVDDTQFITLEEFLSRSASKLSDKYPVLVMEAGIGLLLGWSNPSESIFSNPASPSLAL